MTDLNPQAKQMADESMVRCLDAQARAIWPQEVTLIQRYALPPEATILDAGCGTGEVASRLAQLFRVPMCSESISSTNIWNWRVPDMPTLDLGLGSSARAYSNSARLIKVSTLLSAVMSFIQFRTPKR